MNIFKLLLLVLFCVVSISQSVENPFWNDGKEIIEFQKIENMGRWEVHIVVAADGSVLANGVMRSEDGGKTWEKVESYPRSTNAGFIVDETTGDILKLHSSDKPTSIMHRSKDHGKSWSEEKIVRKKDSRGWLPTNMHCEPGITLRYGSKQGRLLMAARVFVDYDNRGRYDEHYSTAIFSDDGGKTWLASEPFPFDGTGEAGLVELSDGRIYYNSRTHTRYGNRLVAISDDGGETWLQGRECDYLPDGPPDFYGCRGGLVRLPIDGYDILIYSQNDDPGGDEARHTQRGRENLTIWASFDGGIIWPVKRHLHKTGGYSGLAAGRAGTPSEGLIYLLSHDGFFARFNLAWITEGKDWKCFIRSENNNK